MSTKAPAWLLAMGVTLLTACGTTSPRTQFYTLEAHALDAATQAKGVHASAGSSSPDAAAVKVSISQVSVPEVVDRPQLVVRTAPNRVDIADFHRWAEPLAQGIARVLAEDLAAQLGGRYLVTAGQRAGLVPDVRVAIDVQRFDAVVGEGVAIEALWTARAARGAAISGRGFAQAPVATSAGPEADGYGALAAAHSRALAEIAGRVSEDVARLVP